MIKYLGQAMNLEGVSKALAMHMKDHRTIIIEAQRKARTTAFYDLYGTEMQLEGGQLKSKAQGE